MDDMKEMQALIKTMIQTQAVRALNDAPEAIEKLVRAAIEMPVDEHGRKPDGYYNESRAKPYLDFIIGDEIRNAARKAVKEVLAERAPQIEAAVRERLSDGEFVSVFSRAVIGAVTDNGWRLDVVFKPADA